MHDSQDSWERFRDCTLMPALWAGIEGAFDGPPDEKAFELYSFWS